MELLHGSNSETPMAGTTAISLQSERCGMDQGFKDATSEVMEPQGADDETVPPTAKERREEECELKEEGFEIPVVWISKSNNESASGVIEHVADDEMTTAKQEGDPDEEKKAVEMEGSKDDGTAPKEEEQLNENDNTQPTISHSRDTKQDQSDPHEVEPTASKEVNDSAVSKPPTQSNESLAEFADEEAPEPKHEEPTVHTNTNDVELNEIKDDDDSEDKYPWVSAFATSVLGQVGLLDETDSSQGSTSKSGQEEAIPPPQVPDRNIAQDRRKSKLRLSAGFVAASTRRLFRSKTKAPAQEETGKSFNGESKNSANERKTPKARKLMKSLSASTRRLFGPKVKDEQSVQTSFSSSACTTNSQETEEDSISTSASSQDDKSVISRLSALVAERSEEMEEELIELIDDVLFEFDSEDVEKELRRHRDTSIELGVIDEVEAQLAKLVDEIDVLRSCGAANCVVECLRDDTLGELSAGGDDVTAKSLTNGEDAKMKKASSSGVVLDTGKMSLADALFDSASLEDDDTLTLEESLGKFDDNGDKFNDFNEAVEALRRCAACQGIGDAVLLEKVRTENKRLETLDRVRYE